MAQMGPILPPKTKLFPRRENIETFQNWGEKGPKWAVLGPKPSLLYAFSDYYYIIIYFSSTYKRKYINGP